MTLRVACALVLASQLVLAAMLLELTGRSAILFSFVGTPLLGAAVLLLMLSWYRNKEESREGAFDARRVDRDPGGGSGGRPARRDD